MWDAGNWDGADWVAMSVMMVVFWGGLIGGLVWAVRAWSPRRTHSHRISD